MDGPLRLEQEISPSPSAVVGVDGGVGLYVTRIAMFEVREGEEVVKGVGDDRLHDGAATDSTRGSWRGRNSLDGGHEESRR